MTPLAYILSLPVRAYRLVGSPFVGMHCRFQPTCSQYALDALTRHGAVKGGWLAMRRILRCHPFGGSGIDEVPQAALTSAPEERKGQPECGATGADKPDLTDRD